MLSMERNTTTNNGESKMEQGRNGEIRLITKECKYSEIIKELKYFNEHYFKINFIPGYSHHKVIFIAATNGPLQKLRKALIQLNNVEAAQIFYH